MGVKTWIDAWPVYRQLKTMDPLGRGAAAKSRTSSSLAPRTRTSDKVVKSICPYCAVGCGQNVYVKEAEGGEVGRAKVIQIEGDPTPRYRAGGCARRGRRACSSPPAARAGTRSSTGARTAPTGKSCR